LGLSFEIQSAVIGKNLTDLQINNLVNLRSCDARLGYRISNNLIGSGLSHIEVYKKAFALGSEWNLILEEDAILIDFDKDLINEVTLKLSEGPVIIQLFTRAARLVKKSSFSELDDKRGDLINKNAGKIFIDLYSHQHKLDSSELEDIVAYLREISEREGQIAIEPLYIKERSGTPDLPIIKDFGLLAFDIFSRIRNSIKYRNTDNYNAKLIFHPKTHNILMVLLTHKSYGDICNTIYSNCNEIEYLDDDTFDLSLSSALAKSRLDKKPVKVNFRQVNAKLIETKLDIDNLKQLNKSARLFKWFLFTKKTVFK
jgi:GR25 family glycosyltransferase involved in LPS biosynthesis